MAKTKAKQNKYKFFETLGIDYGDAGNGISVVILENRIKDIYRNKIYNIWINKFTWSGLDEENKEQQQNYIMRKFWSEGTIAAFPIKNTELMGFTSYSTNLYNMYDFPAAVFLRNERGVSAAIIPETRQDVGKDVVLGWAEPNHKPIAKVVEYYVERIAQVEMVINTNLQLQKMPWLIGVDEIDKDKMRDIVKRILNNEVVVFADLTDLQKIQTLATQTPYIIDKLSNYRCDLEKELLTFLGIDNNGSEELEQTHISIDAVNANNSLIQSYGDAIHDEINRFLDRVNKTFNRNIHIKPNVAEVASIHEEPKAGGNEDVK